MYEKGMTWYDCFGQIVSYLSYPTGFASNFNVNAAARFMRVGKLIDRVGVNLVIDMGYIFYVKSLAGGFSLYSWPNPTESTSKWLLYVLSSCIYLISNGRLVHNLAIRMVVSMLFVRELIENTVGSC